MRHLASPLAIDVAVCGVTCADLPHFNDCITTGRDSVDCPACIPAKSTRDARIKELEEWRPLLIEYTLKKIRLEDWHGVADGAMDLRDLDSELDGLRY